MVPIDEGGKVGWEEITCPLCGAADEEPVIALPAEAGREVYRVVRCRGCGMGYLNPRPDLSSIGHFYSDEYEEYQLPKQHRQGWWQQVRDRLERLVLSRYYGYPPRLEHWYEKALAVVLRAWFR